MKSLVFISRTGCLLPVLIIFNLFFGWLFLKPLHWLVFEVVLIFLFIFSSFWVMKKFFSQNKKYSNVIDVEAKHVENTKDTESKTRIKLT